MYTLNCIYPGCNGEFEVTYDDIGNFLTCPECQNIYEVCYDETYDEENDYYDEWWYLIGT